MTNRWTADPRSAKLTPGRCRVMLSFDIDAEAGLMEREGMVSLSATSDRLFGLRRGLPGILELLRELDVPATFFVPGIVAERHRTAIAEIAAGGHEIAHHGYRHLRPHGLDRAAAADEVARGLDALAPLAPDGVPGYRSPGWELTDDTLDLLADAGIRYDSSLMEDDRPYLVRSGPRSLIELPPHWLLDDWPFFGHGHGIRSTGSAEWACAWGEEIALAVAAGRPLVLTMHPEICGRARRLTGLREIVEQARQLPGVAFSTMAQACDDLALA